MITITETGGVYYLYYDKKRMVAIFFSKVLAEATMKFMNEEVSVEDGANNPDQVVIPLDTV